MIDRAYTFFVSRLLFPLHEKLKHHSTVAIKRQLEISQWWTRERILEAQNGRLNQFIEKIYQTVPYYRSVMDNAGLTPDGIRNKADLAKLPLLDKATIKQHFDQLKASDAGPLKRFNTGGSSGQPLVFLLGNERVSHDVAEKWRATRWWDVDIGDKEIVAWGSPIELGAQDKVRIIRDKLFRSHLIPAFDMSEQNLLVFIHKIVHYKPAMLFGYPSVFDLIATTARKNQIRLDNLGIKVAFVTSERLYPYQRENIEATFGCPVANGYGGRDAGFIAHQCPDGNMHLSAEDIIVEILDPQGNPVADGDSGEIVVTHMGTSEFPFVRYRTGDIGALDIATCSCGRGLPILKSIEGRSTDFVVAHDGTIMHGLSLIYILRDIERVEAFRIVQQSLNLTDIEIVLKDKKKPTDELQASIITQFKQRLGEAVDINIQWVDQIQAETSGKYRYVVSKITR